MRCFFAVFSLSLSALAVNPSSKFISIKLLIFTNKFIPRSKNVKFHLIRFFIYYVTPILHPTMRTVTTAYLGLKWG